ncbi:MAG: carboxypeptidase regulatory-like domain-containing protein, partial [Deltaproteobacteria bacterium]|nr:carboxypeptidase regulatory-like domain-containing protein [Deltaproteobacteria bacterium]
TVKSYASPEDWNTSISGRVLDADGNPVAGARVHVYTYVQMSERPKYVGERTGADGKYTVSLPKGGTYYLAARNRFGGPPRIGDLYGRYD